MLKTYPGVPIVHTPNPSYFLPSSFRTFVLANSSKKTKSLISPVNFASWQCPIPHRTYGKATFRQEIKTNTTVGISPYLPHFAPWHFSMFPKLKIFKRFNFESLEDIQNTVITGLKGISENYVHEWQRRCSAVKKNALWRQPRSYVVTVYSFLQKQSGYLNVMTVIFISAVRDVK